LDDDAVNPKIRYDSIGCFDEEAYESDLEQFPDYFDRNGWPLFDDYDPYSLKHPITGESWHLSPRVPKMHESGSNYECWFLVATTFISITSIGSALLNVLRARKKPIEEPRSGVVHRASHPSASLSNSSNEPGKLPKIGILFQVLIRDDNVEQALRALKKKMQREGVFREMKQRRAYEKPSERRIRERQKPFVALASSLVNRRSENAEGQ